MEGMRLSLPFLLLAAIAHQSIALKCSPGCVGNSGNVFKYQAGSVYKYELEGNSVMSLAGADGDAAKMTVKAAADVAALPNCGFSVTLTSYQVTDKDGKTLEGDKGKPVLFSMNNGVITSDICSAKDEPVDALNVKRAVISLLQSSSDSNSKSEIDIFGTCPTETMVHKSGAKLKVKKVKNLNNCAHRQHLNLPYSATHYHSASDVQSIPWITATQKTDQDVENQVKWAMSKEEYVAPPATGQDIGATVTVTTKLTLKGTGGGAAPPAGIERERSIIIDVWEPTGENNLKHASQLLKKACQGAQGEMSNDNADLFAYLTHVISRSNKATINGLLNQVKQGQICPDKETAKKILFDAIFDSQSSDGVQAMADLLKNKEVTGLKAQMWYASLGNVQHATLSSIKAVSAMLDNEAPIEAYIGAGSLLGRYCHDHSCDGVPEVNQLQKKLIGSLAKGCKAPSIADEDKLLASIKGLGNSGYLGGAATKQLIQCATDHSARSRVRAAALDALHADPNKENIKKAAISILKDKSEDSELRIKAYLIIVECPCGQMASVIKQVLENEESYQVGNFIVSHLRNIRSSKNPDKAKAQAHFSGILSTKSYPFDLRKYSTNLESSYMLDSLNFGGSAESNVIYSQKSWIPRSVCLNLTSHMFGSNFNLVELDVRAENLEKIVEKIIGPKGYLRHDPEEISKDTEAFLTDANNRANRLFRPKRGVSQNDIDAVAKQVKLGADFDEQDESLDLSLKTFGSEVAWIPLHGAQLDRKPADSVNKAFDMFEKILDKAKNVDIDYTKHKILSHGEVAYPTAMGVPLKLTGLVTAAVHVKLDGNLDIPVILKDPKNAHVKFQIIPSGAVTGSLISWMESAGVTTGFKVSATAHSSTGTDVTFKVLEGKGVDVKVGLPLPKQEVLTFKTEINSFTNTPQDKTYKPVNFNTKREEYSGCFDQVSEMMGLTFCGEVSSPWDGSRIISPVFGPLSLTARIEKEDPSLNSFHFKAFYNIQQDAPQHHFEIVLDTPNSKKERRLGVLVENTISPNLAFKASVDSPMGGLKVDTSAINTAEEKSVNAELIMMDQEYVFKAGIKQSSPNKYKPFLEYKAPEQPKGRFSGLTGGKQAQQVGVSGEIEVKGPKMELHGVKVTVARQEYNIDGTAWDDDKKTGVDLKIKSSDDTVTLKASREKINPHHTKRTFALASEKYQDASVSASWDLDFVHNKKTTDLKSDITVVHGPDPNSDTSKIAVSNSYKMVNNAKGHPIEVDSKNLVTYPIVNLKGKVDFHGNAEKFGYDVEGSFETYHGASSLEVLVAPEYSIDSKNKLMDNSLDVHMKRQKTGDHQSKFTNSLEIVPGGKYQMDADVVHKFEVEDVDAHVDAKITLPTEPSNIDFKAGVKDNKNVHEGMIWANAGGKDLIDGKVNLHKGNDLSGDFKFILPQLVDSNGKFKYGPGGLDGNALIHFVKANRKIEGKTHFVTTNPHYKGTADVCLDSKCVKFSTDTTVNTDSYSTKNKLELPAGLTVGVTAAGEEPKGSHSAEAEVKTSDGHETKLHYKSVRHMRPGDTDVEYTAGIESVAKAGAKPHSLETKVVGKHIDLDKQTGDGQILITYRTPEDKDLSFHTNFKRAPAADHKWTQNTEVGVTGSLITHPVNLKLESELHEDYFDLDSGESDEDLKLPPAHYHLKLDVGNELNLDSQGKVDGHSSSNELNVNLPQATTGIKNFKWSTSNYIDLLADHSKVKTSNTIKWDDKFVKTNFEANEEENGVNFNADFEADAISKKTISGNAHYCDLSEGGVCKSDSSVALTWDGKKADVTIASEMDSDKKIGQVHVKGTLMDGTKFDINSKGKCNNQGDQDVSLHGETVAVIGDKKWASTGTVEIDSTKYNLNFELEQPEGKSYFKSHSMKKGERHWVSDFGMKWLSNGGGSVVGDMIVNAQSENDFAIVYNIDAPVLNLNKFHLGAKVTPDKKLDIEVNNNGQTVAAAKTTYNYEMEGTKAKVGGSGNINVNGKDYPLTYDATFQAKPEAATLLTVTMNAKAGDRTFKFDSDAKTNSYHAKRTYCKAPGDCSEAEMLFETKNTGPLSYEQNIIYNIDFSLFNPKLKDFKLSSKIKADGLTYDQNSEYEWGDSKLSYVSFVHPKKAGATLTLPQRTLSAEATYGLTNKKEKHGLKFDGSLWLNKAKEPNKKGHVVINGEVGLDKDLFTAHGEAKINTPSLPKPIGVKGKLSVTNSHTNPSGEGSFELDIFKNPSMKIIGAGKFNGELKDDGFDGHASASVKSEELKINANFDSKVSLNKDSATLSEKLVYTNAKGEAREASVSYELNSQKLHVVVKAPTTTLLDYLVKWDVNEDTYAVSESLDLLGSKYSDHLDIKLKPLHLHYKFLINQGCDSKPMTVDATFEMGKATTLDFGFAGKSILKGEISLAESDFLKSHVKYDKDVLPDVRECIKKSGEFATKTAEDIIGTMAKPMREEVNARSEMFKNAAVDWELVGKNLHNEMDKIQDEIMADKNIQQTVSLIKETLNVFLENSVQSIEEAQALYNNAVKEITQIVTDLSNTINELIPKVAQSFEDLAKAALSLSQDMVHIFSGLADALLNEISAHSDEINALIQSVSDVSEEYGKTLYKYADLLNKNSEEFVQSVVEQLKELPVGELISEQIETIRMFIESNDPGVDFGEVSQEVVDFLEDLINQLSDSKTFPELVEFLKTLTEWIKKTIINKEEVDNMEYAKRVSKEFYAVVKHLADFVKENFDIHDDALSKSKLPTLSSLPLTRIPPGLLRVSGLSWITSKDLPSLIQVISTYLPAANPDDWIPPFTARAYLLGGSEIITFDGSHLSVGGDCSYVLTQDYLDSNFSVIGQFKGGKLESIQVSDGADTIELRHAKKPLVNGKESEFPIFQGQLKSWKRTSVVGLATKSGLKILCTPDCLRCKFKINGLYFGRLRGLLGTYNYERYDELALPSGEIADNADQFLASWTVGGNCNANSPKPAKREATCTKTFTDAPDFIACYHLVNAKPYREACDNLAAKETTPEGLQAAVCNVAFAYSLHCQTRIPTAVPTSCLKCMKSKANVFQSTGTVEPPFKKADVVFSVERWEENKQVYDDLIKPLVQTIKADLAAKGISDVKFGLVGFGGLKNVWPAYYTDNGKILSDDLESGNLAFDQHKKRSTVSNVVEDVAAESGVTAKGMTYMDLVEYYPWRTGSSKVVVGVHATPCKGSHALFMLQQLYYIGSYTNKGIIFHAVSPVEDLKLPGGDEKKIIAIANDEVFSVEDAGKSPLKGHGNKDAEDKISYDSDACFTLVHMTGGSVFPNQNFIEGGAAEKEAFKKVLGSSIVESLTDKDHQKTQKCSCHPKTNPYDGIFAQSDCRIVNI